MFNIQRDATRAMLTKGHIDGEKVCKQKDSHSRIIVVRLCFSQFDVYAD